MGILRNGIFGGFENKIGHLVGRRVKGKDVISSKPHKSTKPRSALQLEQQYKLALVISVMKLFSGLIAVGFKNVKRKGSAFNAAVKYNFENIITGTSPDYTIDYKKMIYSKGSLSGPTFPDIRLQHNVAEFCWEPDHSTQFRQDTDKASFIIYCPDKNFLIISEGAVARSAYSYPITLPRSVFRSRIYCFMNFVSADGKLVSNSVYIDAV